MSLNCNYNGVYEVIFFSGKKIEICFQNIKFQSDSIYMQNTYLCKHS